MTNQDSDPILNPSVEPEGGATDDFILNPATGSRSRAADDPTLNPVVTTGAQEPHDSGSGDPSDPGDPGDLGNPGDFEDLDPDAFEALDTEVSDDPVPEEVDASGAGAETTASAFYDADRPPFDELPEQPKRPPAPEPAPPVQAGLLASRTMQVRVGAAVVGALLALLLLGRRRRRHRPGQHVRGRGRRT